MQSTKPTISLDFDGCIHSYDRGWGDGTIYGGVVPGFEDWLAQIEPHFHVVVHTSRNRAETQQWLWDRGIALDVQNEKPPAWVSIDDRAIRFEGRWDDKALSADALRLFRPWNVRDR